MANTDGTLLADGLWRIYPHLTDRQRQVCYMVSEGFSQRQIAADLCISRGRVQQILRAVERRASKG